MGYSTEFLQGILSLWIIAAVGAFAIGAADALLGLGIFDGDYPVAWAEPREQAGLGAFALQCAGVVGLATALMRLTDRYNR